MRFPVIKLTQAQILTHLGETGPAMEQGVQFPLISGPPVSTAQDQQQFWVDNGDFTNRLHLV